MDRFLVALTLLLCSPWADAQLTGNSNGYDWRKALANERRSLVNDAQMRVNAQYPPQEMFACLNEVFADPIRPHIHERSLAVVMAVCDRLIKSL